MTVTIRMPRRKRPADSTPPRERKARQKARPRATGHDGSGRPRGTIERLFFFLFLALPFVTLIQSVFARTVAYVATAAQAPQETILSGPGWAFVVPFAVTNKDDIEELIQCESGGQNVSLPDTDGITSDGILQFHRGPNDTMDRGTWEDFSKASGLTGSPRNPADAIRMTDWAISHDLGPRWTCWQRKGLSPGY